MSNIYLLKKVNEIFGIVIYFVYICIVIYSCSLFENINSYNNSFKIVILIISLNYWFGRNRYFYGMASESFHFLFIDYAVGFGYKGVYLLKKLLYIIVWYSCPLYIF